MRVGEKVAKSLSFNDMLEERIRESEQAIYAAVRLETAKLRADLVAMFTSADFVEVSERLAQTCDDETLIRDLGFTTRIRNCLQSENIRTIGQLKAAGILGLLKIPNFGRKSLKEVRAVALLAGFDIPDMPQNYPGA